MNHYQVIINYFDNRSTNASAESFNAKTKAIRLQIRGVRNIICLNQEQNLGRSFEKKNIFGKIKAIVNKFY